jgi:hypothetical protein
MGNGREEQKTQTRAGAYSKTPLYASDRSSLHLRPASFRAMQFLVPRFRDSGRATCRVSRRLYSVRAPVKIHVTKTTETETASNDAPTIPPLSRPLGVPDVPTTKVKTLSEKSEDFLNQEKHLEKRRHLCVGILDSASRSYADALMGAQGKRGVHGILLRPTHDSRARRENLDGTQGSHSGGCTCPPFPDVLSDSHVLIESTLLPEYRW